MSKLTKKDFVSMVVEHAIKPNKDITSKDVEFVITTVINSLNGARKFKERAQNISQSSDIIYDVGCVALPVLTTIQQLIEPIVMSDTRCGKISWSEYIVNWQIVHGVNRNKYTPILISSSDASKVVYHTFDSPKSMQLILGAYIIEYICYLYALYNSKLFTK